MRFLSQLFAALAIGLLGYWLGTRHASTTKETRVVTVQSTSSTPKPKTKGTNGQTAGYHPGMAAALLAELEACDTDDDRDRLLTIRIHEMNHDHWPSMADGLRVLPFIRNSFILSDLRPGFCYTMRNEATETLYKIFRAGAL